MSVDPRAAVFALARTQNDWLSLRATIVTPEGFADGRDPEGHLLRYVGCPDCLANDQISFGCETCHGRGEIPDDQPDPMRVKAVGQQGFYGHDVQEARDRVRAVDAQIMRLRMTARQREGVEAPEDWLERMRRVRDAHMRLGDYPLLEAAQDRLGWSAPAAHMVWMRCVADGLPCAPATRGRLDVIADGLALWMLGAIAATRLSQHIGQRRLGISRPKLRPDTILVPAGLLDTVTAEPGKGRWANQHTQGQRNALIVGMAADGKTAGEIARQVGLTKRRVQQMLAEVRVQATATGPAA